MHKRNYATALPAVAGLAVLLLTACSGSGSSHPSGGTATISEQQEEAAASTIPVTAQADSNWAGYVVARHPTTRTTYSHVSGSWTQPSVFCQASFPSHSAFWVGLGGYSGEHLEQTGTSADCSASGQAIYSVWYELVPAAQVPVSMTVHPGDRISAHVAVSGDTVTVSISDLTRHTTFSKRLQMTSPSISSAEWIAEAPSQCVSSSSRDCHILSLADFGGVRFTGASVSSGDRTGSITSGLGQVSELTLQAAPGFGRLYATAAQANAVPRALSGNGSSFTVSWQRPQIQMPAPPVIVSGPIYH